MTPADRAELERYRATGLTPEDVERHHIYGGARRKHSERYGLVVDLCRKHHTGPKWGAHSNKATATFLKQHGQLTFENTHSREEFMRIFGKNYLEDEE